MAPNNQKYNSLGLATLSVGLIGLLSVFSNGLLYRIPTFPYVWMFCVGVVLTNVIVAVFQKNKTMEGTIMMACSFLFLALPFTFTPLETIWLPFSTPSSSSDVVNASMCSPAGSYFGLERIEGGFCISGTTFLSLPSPIRINDDDVIIMNESAFRLRQPNPAGTPCGDEGSATAGCGYEDDESIPELGLRIWKKEMSIVALSVSNSKLYFSITKLSPDTVFSAAEVSEWKNILRNNLTAVQ